MHYYYKERLLGITGNRVAVKKNRELENEVVFALKKEEWRKGRNGRTQGGKKQRRRVSHVKNMFLPFTVCTADPLRYSSWRT